MLINQGLGTKMTALIQNHIKLVIINQEGHHGLWQIYPSMAASQVYAAPHSM
jgi:hypothetical protein